jgi:hypothetical protein
MSTMETGASGKMIPLSGLADANGVDMSTEPGIAFELPAQAAVMIAPDEHGRVVIEQHDHSVTIAPRDAVAAAIAILECAGYHNLILVRAVEGGYLDFDENEPPDDQNAALKNALKRIERDRERFARELEEPLPVTRSAGALRQKRYRDRQRNVEAVTSVRHPKEGDAA